MPRLVHLLNHWPGGGVESVVECLVEQSVAAGQVVGVAVLNPVVRPSPVLEACGVSVIRCSAKPWNRVRGFLTPVSWSGLSPEALALFRECETVQAHHPLAQATAARWKTALGFRLDSRVHNMGESWMAPRTVLEHLFADRVRRGLRASDRVICVGEAVREAIVALLPDIAARTEVELNPLPAWLHSTQRSDSPRYEVVVVGRLDEQKQSDLAARILGQFLVTRPLARAAIVGDGPLATVVDAILHQYGVSERVDRMGWLSRRDAVGVMVDSRVLLQPSRYEGSPITVREALVLGLRIVASDIPPHQELARASTGRISLIAIDGSDAVIRLEEALR